jgi:hypothetical protein
MSIYLKHFFIFCFLVFLLNGSESSESYVSCVEIDEKLETKYQCTRRNLDKAIPEHQKVKELKEFFQPNDIVDILSVDPNRDLNALIINLGVDKRIVKKLILTESKFCFLKSEQVPKKRSSFLSWCEGRLLSISLNFYIDTGDEDFLTIFTAIADHLIYLADDRQGLIDDTMKKSLPVWSSNSNAKFTHSSIIWYQLSRFVELINQTNVSQKSLQDKSHEYLSILEKAVFSFDTHYLVFDSDKDTCWYKVHSPENAKWHNEPHPFNHLSFLGATHTILSTLSDDPNKYIDKVKCLGNFWLKHTSTLEDGSLVWPYGATRSNKLTEQIWKAGYTIIFPVEAIKRGVYFDENVLRGLYISWTNSTKNPGGFNVRLPGKDKRLFDELKDHHKYGNWYLFADRTITTWSILISVCPDLEKIMLDKINNHSRYFENGWMSWVNLQAYSYLNGQDHVKFTKHKKYTCSSL